MLRRTMHDRIAAFFLFLGAVFPILLTFGLVYFAPQLYAAGAQKVAPLIDAMRQQVVATHDARALNAFDVALGGGALVSMYLGLAVGRVLNLIQRFVEHRLGTHAAQPQNS